MTQLHFDNLAPERFTFWSAPAGSTVQVGPNRWSIDLPAIPLPLHRHDLADAPPADAAIGQGVYDYLRQFPDCAGNVAYAELLRDAYPHFISDLASHAVMLDAKEVEPAYVLRKLNCLKILQLLEPCNRGLLLQLCHGFFELALEFAELASCRRHLRESLRYGQEMLRLEPCDPDALALLAEVDLLFGDTPAAGMKWRRLAEIVDDSTAAARIDARIALCASLEPGETTLVDALEAVAEAMHLHTLGDHAQATYLLERIEEEGRLTTLLPSADFYWLLGICRRDSGDLGGAHAALLTAMELEPAHAAAAAALDAL